MNKKIVYFALALLLIGFLLVESSMYILPYIEGFKELEIAIFMDFDYHKDSNLFLAESVRR